LENAAIDQIELDEIVQKIAKALKLPKKSHKFLIGATKLDIWAKLLELAENPDFSSYRDKIQEAAGTWIITNDRNNPLWVKY
jgi:hypothetical protein